MNTEHDLRRRFTVLVEILLNDGHHEFHRGVIVIEQGHLVERRRLEDLPLQQGFCVVLGCHTLILMLSQWLSCAISTPFQLFSILRVFLIVRRWRPCCQNQEWLFWLP